MTLTELLSALAIAAIWGLNFSFIKLGVAHVDPLVLAALRFALCALPLVFFVKRPAIAWGWLVAYGMAFGVGTWGVVTLSLRSGMSPGLAAWLLQSSAFLTPLLAWVWLGEAMSPRQRWGALIAALGFSVVVAGTGGATTAVGLLLMLLAAVSLSVANVMVRRSGVKHMLALIAWSSLFSPIPLLALALLGHGTAVLTALPAQLAAPTALASLIFQVYPTTLLGYWVWNTLIARRGAAVVAPVALMVPIFALGFSALIFGLRPTLMQALGMGLIGGGLVITATRLGLPWTRRKAQLTR